jgi:hypothetical protein
MRAHDVEFEISDRVPVGDITASTNIYEHASKEVPIYAVKII